MCKYSLGSCPDKLYPICAAWAGACTVGMFARSLWSGMLSECDGGSLHCLHGVVGIVGKCSNYLFVPLCPQRRLG